MSEERKDSQRCDNCDAVNSAGSIVCKLCGEMLLKSAQVSAEDVPPPISPAPANSNSTDTPILLNNLGWLKWVAIAASIAAIIGAFLIQLRPRAVATAFLPTATTVVVRPTATAVPSPAATVTATPVVIATATPVATATDIVPTDTPQPPRPHNVSAGETMISIALFYGINLDSIIEANGVDPTTLREGQEIFVPWPTATPPLEPLELELNGETVIADPTDCNMYEVQDSDTLFGIALTFNNSLDAILAINRLTESSVISPGDSLCIPTLIYSEALQVDFGSVPLATAAVIEQGPLLLYPPSGTIFEEAVTLQWLAERELAAYEWYMVEVTNLSDADARPQRAFTRGTSLQAPAGWRPAAAEQSYRWRVSIVAVTGTREDGAFVYSYGGPRSADGLFVWDGE